jgi:putative transposase
MPRTRRLIDDFSVNHVLCRGNNQQRIFWLAEDFEAYLTLIERYKREHPVSIFHYCLMPNHVHMLLQVLKASDLSKLMQKVNLAYFHHYKKHYGYRGHLFQDRFRSVPINKEQHLFACGRYIEMNPVRGEIVSDPSEYPFSSFRFYSLGEESSILTPNPFFMEMGTSDEERRRRFQQFVLSDYQTDEIKKSLRASPEKQKVF